MLNHTSVVCLLIFFALCCATTSSTPIHNHLEANSPQCPVSWFQYGKFCVTHAPPGSERAVAFYCDGLGGIGVHGICVIKARPVTAGMNLPKRLSSLALLTSPQGLSLDEGVDEARRAGDVMKDEEQREQEVGEEEEEEEAEEEEQGICPEGWSLYKSMCVLRPELSQERCYQMDSVPFHGMCLKHAEPRPANHIAEETGVKQDKRVCCCSHPDAIHNSYGC